MIHKTVCKFSTQSAFPKKRFCLCLRTFYENTYLVACLLRILLVPCLLFCSKHTSKLLPSTIFPITVKHTVCTYKKNSSFFFASTQGQDYQVDACSHAFRSRILWHSFWFMIHKIRDDIIKARQKVGLVETRYTYVALEFDDEIQNCRGVDIFLNPGGLAVV